MDAFRFPCHLLGPDAAQPIEESLKSSQIPASMVRCCANLLLPSSCAVHDQEASRSRGVLAYLK